MRWIILIAIASALCGCGDKAPTKPTPEQIKASAARLMPALATSAPGSKPVFWVDTNGCLWCYWRGRTNGPNCPAKEWSLPPFKYPTNFSAYVWQLQQSTNLIAWVTVTSYVASAVPTGTVNVINGSRQMYFRMKGVRP